MVKGNVLKENSLFPILNEIKFICIIPQIHVIVLFLASKFSDHLRWLMEIIVEWLKTPEKYIFILLGVSDMTQAVDMRMHPDHNQTYQIWHLEKHRPLETKSKKREAKHT